LLGIGQSRPALSTTATATAYHNEPTACYCCKEPFAAKHGTCAGIDSPLDLHVRHDASLEKVVVGTYYDY
jgi:hypothetical protein